MLLLQAQKRGRSARAEVVSFHGKKRMDRGSRQIQGTLIFPADAPTTAAEVVIELRDVSYADAPAPIVASISLPRAAILPHARIRFEFIAPASAVGQRLSLACHVRIMGCVSVAHGDLLSTQSVPVPNQGQASVDVPLTLV